MVRLDARGDTCPIPVVKARNAIREFHGSGTVEIMVDNEIAVQNLEKMSVQKGYQISSEKLEEQQYRVLITVGETDEVTDMEKQEELVVKP